MASKKLLPHTITIFTDIGEDERYHTQYSKVVYQHVNCQGLTESYQAKKPSDPVTIYMFDHATTNVSQFQPLGNGKEYVVPYDASNLDRPPDEALNIRRVIRRKNGTRRMWHWEVYAE